MAALSGGIGTSSPIAADAAAAPPAAAPRASGADFTLPSRFRPEAFAAATSARGKRPAGLCGIDDAISAVQSAADPHARLASLAGLQRAVRSYLGTAADDHPRTRVCRDLLAWADGAAALWAPRS